MFARSERLGRASREQVVVKSRTGRPRTSSHLPPVNAYTELNQSFAMFTPALDPLSRDRKYARLVRVSSRIRRDVMWLERFKVRLANREKTVPAPFVADAS